MGNKVLSYRRDDSSVVYERIAGSLCDVFGANSVFRDVSAILGGVYFRESLRLRLPGPRSPPERGFQSGPLPTSTECCGAIQHDAPHCD